MEGGVTEITTIVLQGLVDNCGDFGDDEEGGVLKCLHGLREGQKNDYDCL